MEVIISVSKSEIARPFSDFLLPGTAGQRRPVGQDVIKISDCVVPFAKRSDGLLELSGFALLCRDAIIVVDLLYATGGDDAARHSRPILGMTRDLFEDFEKLHLSP